MKRVTVEEVREAIQRIGFNLRPKVTLDRKARECCPLGALCLDRGVKFSGLDIGRDYKDGFIHGFDYPELPSMKSVLDATRYTEGVADGMALHEFYLQTISQGGSDGSQG